MRYILEDEDYKISISKNISLESLGDLEELLVTLTALIRRRAEQKVVNAKNNKEKN